MFNKMLYEEDHFHPTNVETTLEDIIPKKTNNELNIIKKVKGFDPNYVVKSIEVMKQNKKGHKKNQLDTIEMYGSGDIGSYIRNAVSGQKTNHIVGSKEENLYFSVIETTGINGRKDPIKLFYDSPEQFESHFHVTVSQQIKENWHKKFMIANK
jgi:hypothetical protein